MIHVVVDYLVAELDAYMRLCAGLSQERVVAARFASPDGTPNTEAAGKVVAAVVNIEEDRVYHSLETFARHPNGTAEIVRPETAVNLYLLFAANLANYSEALKAVSIVVAFFQHRGVFDCAEIKGLDRSDGRIVCELFSATFEQQNHIWGALGAKYMPSVLYKLGIVGIRDKVVEGEVAPVRDIEGRAA